VKSTAQSAGSWRTFRLSYDQVLRGAIPVLVVLLLGLALARLPVTWAAALIVGSAVLILIFVRPVVGLYLLIFAIPFGSLKEISFGVINIGGAEALAGIAVVAWVARMIAEREAKTVRAPLLVPLLLVVGVASFSMLGSLSLQWSLKGLLLWLELLAIYLLVVNVVEEKDVKIIVILVMLAGCLEALLGIYQFFGRIGPEGFLLFDRFIRAYGTFEQPNPYGGYLALILPLALALVLARWRWRDLWSMVTWGLAGVSLALMSAALLMTWSRGAWLGFISGAAVVIGAGLWHRAFGDVTAGVLAGLASAGLGTLWLLRTGRDWLLGPVLGVLAGLGAGVGVAVAIRRRWAWVLLAWVLVFGSVFLLLGGERLLPASISARFTDFLPYLRPTDVRGIHVTDENFAVVERLAHWEAALGMVRDHPLLGVGIGNYVPVYPAYALPGWSDPLGHAHNYYLHIAAEAGLLGLAAYVLFLLAAFWHGWRSVAALRGIWQGVALGILGVLAAFAVHSVFDNLFVHGMNMHLAMMLGLMYVLTHRCGVSVVETS
jgi:putative inorganic carbon (HCO3(-)) transporter